MEINFPPGLELNALVSEKVMGDKVVKRMWGIPARDVGGQNYAVPDYSGDIAAAWRVVEKLQAFLFQIDRNEKVPGMVSYHVRILHRSKEIPDAWSRGTHADAETAPHAICLAALEAVGYKEG